MSTLGTIGSRALALTTICSSVSSVSASAPVRGAPATRALITSTCDEAMRAIDEPMTRLICSTRSAEATSPAMSRPTSVRISTSAAVNATSSSRGTG